MKNKLGLTLGMILASAAAAPMAFADDANTAENTNEVIGEIVQIEDSFYTIRDQEGNEHRFHYDGSTQAEGTVAEGATVEAYVNADGHITRIEAE